jgi:hypothetical protein
LRMASSNRRDFRTVGQGSTQPQVNPHPDRHQRSD